MVIILKSLAHHTLTSLVSIFVLNFSDTITDVITSASTQQNDGRIWAQHVLECTQGFCKPRQPHLINIQDSTGGQEKEGFPQLMLAATVGYTQPPPEKLPSVYRHRELRSRSE